MYTNRLDGEGSAVHERVHAHEREPERESVKGPDRLPPLVQRLAELQKAQDGLKVLSEGRGHVLIAGRSHSDHDKHDNGHEAHSDHDAHDNHMDRD
ncbi:MAG: hypothetical protein JXA24_05410 [Proteobacteria bacterium]|nr:hypothetical protein [Pseudomonadota bacterium]